MFNRSLRALSYTGIVVAYLYTLTTLMLTLPVFLVAACIARRCGMSPDRVANIVVGADGYWNVIDENGNTIFSTRFYVPVAASFDLATTYAGLEESAAPAIFRKAAQNALLMAYISRIPGELLASKLQKSVTVAGSGSQTTQVAFSNKRGLSNDPAAVLPGTSPVTFKVLPGDILNDIKLWQYGWLRGFTGMPTLTSEGAN